MSYSNIDKKFSNIKEYENGVKKLDMVYFDIILNKDLNDCVQPNHNNH